MKIVQFIYGLTMGGAETLVKNYALHMHDAGHEVTVLCMWNACSPYDYELKARGIRVVYISEKLRIGGGHSFFAKVIRKLAFMFAAPLYIRHFFRKYKPDILHFHLESSRILRLAKPPITTRLFYTHHNNAKDWLTNPKRRRDVKNLKWLMCHYSVRLIALHEQMRDILNTAFNVDNTIVLNNGVDMSRFRNAKHREVIRKELGIPQDAFVVGHVGRFDPVKNHTFLVKVFKAVKDRVPEAFLLMIAGGK